MITLITGQPGNGKTLHALWLIEKLRKETGREVYYWNIKGLTLPWKPLGDAATFGSKEVEPDASVVSQWYKLPDGAIIVVDECQKLWRVRSQGSQVPKTVAEMETHRHKGFDLFLISQNLKQIDTAVRVLVGRHINVVRRFGFESGTLYQWERCADPTSDRDKKEALKESWSFPKDVYSWYKSAEIHTVKRDFPLKKLAVLVFGVVVVAVSIGVVVRHVQQLQSSDVAGPAVSQVVGEISMNNPWGEVRKERLPGMPASAPFYDELQEPQDQPAVAGCGKLVYSDGTVICRCTTSQGSVVAMETAQCLQMMRFGWFDPTRPRVDPKQANIDYLNARDEQGSRSNGGVSGSVGGTTQKTSAPSS